MFGASPRAPGAPCPAPSAVHCCPTIAIVPLRDGAVAATRQQLHYGCSGPPKTSARQSAPAAILRWQPHDKRYGSTTFAQRQLSDTCANRSLGARSCTGLRFLNALCARPAGIAPGPWRAFRGMHRLLGPPAARGGSATQAIRAAQARGGAAGARGAPDEEGGPIGSGCVGCQPSLSCKRRAPRFSSKTQGRREGRAVPCGRGDGPVMERGRTVESPGLSRSVGSTPRPAPPAPPTAATDYLT